MLSDKIESIALSGTMEISAKLFELRNSGIIAYDLCVGEPDLPTPDHIKNAAKLAIDENKTKYTINSGILELRKAICTKFLNEYDAHYETNEIIVTNGAKQAVYNALQTIISEGDEVLIPSPYYVSYPHMVRLAGGIPRFIETNMSDSYQIKTEALKTITNNKTKAIIICNPCNPTGMVYTKDQLQEIVEFAIENNLIILADEIYEKLVYDSEAFISLSSLGKEYRENIIIVNGVSKAYSMTGWRIGYAVASKEIISGMNKVQSHSTSNPCTISQYASLEAITSDQSLVEKQRAIFEERRHLVNDMLLESSDIDCVKPKGAFYF
ncbi:MAG: pyridoxal phosphate-dependent aminotransferase, partial [Melioribacteraceae bacterium]|nr:pyridoxal phosphate-dependent aminotransferase [Melioribacteraceae bacterium]